jgi:hypothetical protein
MRVAGACSSDSASRTNARGYLFIDGAWRDHVLTSLTNPAYDDAWLARAS